MNNLLRTLTESQVKSSFPDTDLKLLLTTVKDGRSYDSKLADPFYDSLEGLLLDLRTVTMDNHDAEAFLKPVLKSDVPDYYDVISNPMDLQTMLKKVKQKQYKTKKEFKDDLDLIWNNCYTYNASENHPLRLCAKRLQLKAMKLLKNITDRKDRTDPSIPSDLCGVHPKINGFINGHSRHRSPSSKSETPVIKHSRKQRRDGPFSESPAILRTPSGMSTFQQLDQEINRKCGSSRSAQSRDNGKLALAERLTDFAVPVEYESDSDDVHSPENGSHELEEEAGEKRKLNGIADHRVRKRARFSTQTQPAARCEDIIDLWWKAVVSDALVANGMPSIRCASSRRSTSASSKTSRDRSKLKPKKQKLSKKTPQSLLNIMNNNIRTMKRVRRTHAKFAALNVNANHEDSDWSAAAPATLGEEAAVDVVDDRPWRPGAVGVEIGEENAGDCMHWMGTKVLEHAGFQGSSKVALDVLASVTSEYLLNVGRTIRFLCDKYSNSMTAEEIILHTLFESGTSKIQDLERYIKDDVIRYGSRLGDLEKKLVSAYREATVTEALDDDALFGNEEDGEEEGAFVMGNFADNFGEDFLGLRELGIAAEYGLSSLTIPKRLLKGKGRGENKLSSSAANPAEPPPPFPPPPPFVPLNLTTLDDQIGLLKPFYQERFASLTAFTPAIPPLPSPAIFGINSVPHPPPLGPPYVGATSPSSVLTVLPDDPPDLSHVKMGPLGQIIKVVPSTGAPKKKAKRKDVIPGLNGDGGLMTPSPLTATTSAAMEPATPKKKKTPGAATGAGSKKKKVKMTESLPPVIAASA